MNNIRADFWNDIVENHPLEYFKKILQIPRRSTDETNICQALICFAEQHCLHWEKDQAGNLLIQKKGKAHEAIILQAHMDMVFETENILHYPYENAIQFIEQEDIIRAKGTSLGADNGLGIAIILSVLASKNLQHPPIEALFTVEEEDGLIGASKIQKNWLKGKYLINLDGEQETAVTVGCAGAFRSEIQLPIVLEKTEGCCCFGDAGDLLTVYDSPLDRRSPAVFREQRRMYVDTAIRRHLENLLRQNLPERYDDYDVRLIFPQFFHTVQCPNPLGLEYGNLVSDCCFLDRRVLHLAAPSLGLVGLCDCEDHLMSCLNQRLQSSYRKIRGSHENNFHLLILLIYRIVKSAFYHLDVHFSLQMINFMTECTGKEFLSFHLYLFHILGQCPDTDIVRPGHGSCLPWNTQARLLPGLLSGYFQNLRVYQHDWPVADINDHNLLQNSYLGCGKPYSLRLIHGIQHVVD